MFGSQALETAIGLAVMFFILAFAASSFVELVSGLLSKRAKDLEAAIAKMLSGKAKAKHPDAVKALDWFKGTSVFTAASVVSKKGKPSYLSAKAFAESVGEVLSSADEIGGAYDELPAELKKRLDALVKQPIADTTTKLLSVKAGLENWYDETMARVQGVYKRWTSILLLLTGLFLAVVVNASAFEVANRLWTQPATRAAVTQASTDIVHAGSTPSDLKSVADTASKLTALKIPAGWDGPNRAVWTGWHWGSMGVAVLGWLATALLVSLGAPFWFDVLTRLSALRNTGARPAAAADDPSSATSLRADRADSAGGSLGLDLGEALDVARTGSDNPPQPATVTVTTELERLFRGVASVPART
ncbi:MAG: hypothetical protein DLM58_09795 [Pseudonocardiales bacterium]|nr:MAG: hypothetical protein DLM58_09795 [Pseudonocardiales bacterium]